MDAEGFLSLLGTKRGVFGLRHGGRIRAHDNSCPLQVLVDDTYDYSQLAHDRFGMPYDIVYDVIYASDKVLTNDEVTTLRSRMLEALGLEEEREA